MSYQILAKDAATELAKAAPPISVGAFTLSGITINEWVALTTLVYVVLQAVFLIYRWRRLARGQDKGSTGE
ncbi:hypothetical protein [Chitinimonas sp. BJB300]|uniref:hypothetical protein n=1 Tax=Chitinimonas sp. BJB300 TaxID=1559339 RepID=UPI000C121335|nr:hypothetical protein [Chitinimonas sp. BJB300]PHV09630.1 hypothetical protein CSQ89_20660 [Chitinimonas sp. BJB300]TSJ83857.1 hypothetical protein FG002_020670 [Chitinimonas sp. BJB300]